MMVARVVSALVVIVASAAPTWGAERENLEIFKDVSQQVRRYPHFTVFDSVHAQVQDGVVTLSGKVTMPYKLRDIERRVANVEGVRQVQNEITLLPVSRFDDDLRFQIARAIYGHSNFWRYGAMVNPPIHIIVDGGRVTLEGVVNNNIDRMLARSIASSFNALSVTSDLKTDAEVAQELERL